MCFAFSQNSRILTTGKQAKLIISFSSLPKSVLEEMTEPTYAACLWNFFHLYFIYFSLLTFYKFSSQRIHFYHIFKSLLKFYKVRSTEFHLLLSLLTLIHGSILCYLRHNLIRSLSFPRRFLASLDNSYFLWSMFIDARCQTATDRPACQMICQHKPGHLLPVT